VDYDQIVEFRFQPPLIGKSTSYASLGWTDRSEYAEEFGTDTAGASVSTKGAKRLAIRVQEGMGSSGLILRGAVLRDRGPCAARVCCVLCGSIRVQEAVGLF
jgi:hypothetical protein